VAIADGLGGGVAGQVHEDDKPQVRPRGVRGEVNVDKSGEHLPLLVGVGGSGHGRVNNVFLKEWRVRDIREWGIHTSGNPGASPGSCCRALKQDRSVVK
jgi:hypothetical protein